MGAIIQTDKYIDRAVVLALRSPQRGFRVGAIIVNGKEVVAEGVNHLSTTNLKSLFSFHAELAALSRSRRSSLKGSTIYIATVAKSGNIKMAKPCLVCAVALNKAGIDKAVYTIDGASIGIVDLTKEVDQLAFYKAADGNGYRY